MSNGEKRFTDVIVVYDYAYINGGAAKVAIQTALVMAEKYNVYYFSAVGPICEELANSDVEVLCLNKADINTAGRVNAVIDGIWNREAQKRFGSFLERFDPKTTILHIHGWSKALSVSVVAEAERRGFVPIITLHDYFSICPNGGLYDYKKCEICNLKSMNLRCFFTNCDKRNYIQKIWRCLRQLVQDKYVKNNPNVTYISISDLNEKLVKHAVKSKKFIRVDNPVALPEVRTNFNCSNRRFLYVGRVSEEKGVELFCQAIERVTSNMPDIEGIVVGTGEKLDELKKQFPDVNFVGWKTSEEVREYMSSATALVFPSKWHETFGLTVIEAMSVGTPCIVSDVTAVADAITNNKSGFIFKSGDLNNLIHCILAIATDSKANTIKKTLLNEFDFDHYSLNAYFKRLENAYSGALEYSSK